jgi:xylulokinase
MGITSMKDHPQHYILGSDLGTSGCKSIVLDAEGMIRGWAMQSYPTRRSHPGWAEQNPQDWFQAFCQTTQSALAQAQVQPQAIAMVCIVGVTHNAVLLDADRQVLRASILYTDSRSEPQSRELLETWGEDIFQRVHNQVSSIWTWPHLLWIRENEPELWSRIDGIMFPKDYVRHCITPSPVSDTIDPAGTLLFDPVEKKWIEPFLGQLGLREEVFPKIMTPMQIAGHVTHAAAAQSGLAPGTPVLVGTTDTAAEVYGSGAVRVGQAIVKLATVGRIAAVANGPLKDPAFLNYPHVLDGLWYPGTTTKFGASAFTWARSAFWNGAQENLEYETLDNLAAGAPLGSGGLIFHPYLDGEFAPSWDPYLRASFTGVSLGHQRRHFTRSVMEGVGFAIRHALESVVSKGLEVHEIRLIGGGSSSRIWPQIMANILRREVLVPDGVDAAYGAGLMAGVAAGFFGSTPDDLNRIIRVRDQITPHAEHMALYDELFAIYQHTASALRDTSHRLHAFQTRTGIGLKDLEGKELE